ncbi:MAG: isochorismatase family protein [Pseudomonadota bacterium]
MDLDSESLGMGQRPALVVVDMSLGFTESESPLGAECSDVIAVNKQILRAFRQQNLPIFFTSVVYHNEYQARVFRARIKALNILEAGSKWVDLHPELERKSDEVLIEKHWPSAFHQTDLDALLRAQSVDSIVVTGLTTSGCVRATAVDGLQYDYPVIVIEDGVGDRNLKAHTANLFDLQAKYADVISSEDFLRFLMP